MNLLLIFSPWKQNLIWYRTKKNNNIDFKNINYIPNRDVKSIRSCYSQQFFVITIELYIFHEIGGCMHSNIAIIERSKTNYLTHHTYQKLCILNIKKYK